MFPTQSASAPSINRRRLPRFITIQTFAINMDNPDLVPYIEGFRTQTEQLVTTLPGKVKKMPLMPIKETVSKNSFEANMQKLLQYLKQVEKACERAKNHQARMQVQDWRTELKSMIDLACKRPDMFVRDHAHRIGSSPLRIHAVEDVVGQHQAMSTSPARTASVNGNNLLALPGNVAGDQEAPQDRLEVLNNQVTAPSPAEASVATGVNRRPSFLEQVQPMVAIVSDESGEITFAPSQGSLSNLFTFGSNEKSSKGGSSIDACSTSTNPQEPTSWIQEDVVETHAGGVSAIAGDIAEYLSEYISEEEEVELETSGQIADKPATLEEDHLQQTEVQACEHEPTETATNNNEYTLGHVFVWSPDHAPPNGDEDVATEQPVENDDEVPVDMTVDASAPSSLQSSTETAAPSAFTGRTEEYTLGHVFVFSPDQAPPNGDEEIVQEEVAVKTEIEASVEPDVVAASDINLETLDEGEVEPSVESATVATTQSPVSSPFTNNDSGYTLGHVFVFSPDHAPPNGDEEVVAVDSSPDTQNDTVVEPEIGALVEVSFETPTECATKGSIDTPGETATDPRQISLPNSTEPDCTLDLAFVSSPADQPSPNVGEVELEAAIPDYNVCCNNDQHQVDDASDLDSLFDPGDASEYLAAALAENWMLSEDDDIGEETPIVEHNAVSEVGDGYETDDSLIIITEEGPCDQVEEALIARAIAAQETQPPTTSSTEEYTLGHVFVWSPHQAPPDRDAVSTLFPVPIENTTEDESTLLNDQSPKAQKFEAVVPEEVAICGTEAANDEVSTVTVEVETESLVTPTVEKTLENISKEVVEESRDDSFQDLVEKPVEKSCKKDFEITVENPEHIIDFTKGPVRTSPTFVPVSRCLTKVLAGITTASVVVGLKAPVTAAFIMYAGIAYGKYRLNH
ncbi:hypothetical protein LTR99_001936 [Exophiala xenobiotica]|uniref:Uncharacterized protein n=1 Tax=Vermiconidia calcicola TaxID=1690605 RepID=A0AAV9QB81_9PEZI|nr:hypothetical protein LTR96_002175 [Exophiala xenobiotica]KAK5536704.1 hypothetical protein LTR25_005378 [Vermiconidia calcicola]KAK5540398.1 hypothetical protein LTR23_006283 [Chaetothyriales sp. CCFEE 6169]KAK5306246.1 hypothetical protein LTR99_001936 [Exophiala xenobiotica]KAK5341774.1 hypothetical protein LTR98_002568 [Exophiala xenobiotica]